MLHDSDMLAYLSMMAPRLKELHRVLKPTGSLYLHCDPTASHYLKVLLDAVFSPANYRNEITWQRTTAHNDAKTWAEVADILLYYGKSNNVTWNTPRAGYDEEYLRVKYRHDDNDGRGPYRLDNMTSPHPRPNMMYEWKGHASPTAGWRYSRETMEKLDNEGRVWYPDSKSKRPQLKRYLEEMKGPVMGCVWTDIPPLNSQAAERLGYPTQKPEALLERIINASSNEWDTILDPFCGCGTAVSTAQRLNRRWIGIDITALAVSLIKHRLATAFGDSVTDSYEVIGEPVSLADYASFSGPRQISVPMVGFRACQRKAGRAKRRGGDKGIDGRIYFHDEHTGGKTKQILISVKGGHLQAGYVRDCAGLLKERRRK